MADEVDLLKPNQPTLQVFVSDHHLPSWQEGKPWGGEGNAELEIQAQTLEGNPRVTTSWVGGLGHIT